MKFIHYVYQPIYLIKEEIYKIHRTVKIYYPNIIPFVWPNSYRKAMRKTRDILFNIQCHRNEGRSMNSFHPSPAMTHERNDRKKISSALKSSSNQHNAAHFHLPTNKTKK